MAVLKATLRDENGKRSARLLRKDGLIPAVIYGHGQPTVSVTLNEHDIDLAVHHGMRILEIKLGKQKENVLIKDLQWDTFAHRVLHVDLARVNLDERVRVTVPIVLRGTAAGVDEGGVLQQLAPEVEIEVAVRQMPDDIRVSVLSLAIDDTIRMGDLELPEGATLLSDAEAAVCSVTILAEEAEAEPVEGEQGDQPEVIGGKPQDDDETPAE